MKQNFILLFTVIVLLSACGDGVPDVKDPHHPVDANGNEITGTEFMKKYCIGKKDSETCAKVSNAVNVDSTRGKMPEGW